MGIGRDETRIHIPGSAGIPSIPSPPHLPRRDGSGLNVSYKRKRSWRKARLFPHLDLLVSGRRRRRTSLLALPGKQDQTGLEREREG
jgi:hypothetical protein